MRYIWDHQLTDAEIHFIGTIVVQWGSMEHEIFIQTLKSFEMQIEEGDQLPSEMNNMQFTSVLKLWKERVVDAAKPRSRKVLEKQHELILSFKESRDALTHGMWDWNREDQSRVSTVRVKKKALQTADFSTGFLQNMSTQLGEINFNIRFPSGTSELAIAQMKQGGYMSRSAWAMVSGDGPSTSPEPSDASKPPEPRR